MSQVKRQVWYLRRCGARLPNREGTHSYHRRRPALGFLHLTSSVHSPDKPKRVRHADFDGGGNGSDVGGVNDSRRSEKRESDDQRVID